MGSMAPAWAKSRKASGVSKGTLYVYFDSKDKLFEVLTIEEKKTLAEVLFKLDPENPDVRAELAALGASFLKHMAEPSHISSIRMVIGAAEKFPRIGQTFYEAGPQTGHRTPRRLSGPPGGGRPSDDPRPERCSGALSRRSARRNP